MSSRKRTRSKPKPKPKPKPKRQPRPSVDLVLNEIDHTYWHGAERIIGTTEALQALGLFDPSRYPIEARDRGDRVHRHIAALNKHRKAPPIRDEEHGYISSWHAFKRIWQPEIILAEWQGWDPDRRVAGTLDILAILQRRGIPKHLAILDLKSGGREDWHKYQLSIYDLILDAWLQRSGPVRLRKLPRINYSVYLRADGQEPIVRAVPFDPVVHSLVAAAQVVRLTRR